MFTLENSESASRKNVKRARSVAVWLACVFFVATVAATAEQPGIALVKPTTYRLKIVLEVAAERQSLSRIKATCPLPADWREQKVKLLKEIKLPGCGSREQTVPGMGRLWIVTCKQIPAGKTLRLERIYEITRFQVVGNLDPEKLTRPRGRTAEQRAALGNSPGIDLADRDLKNLAEQLAENTAMPGEFVRAAAAWVRENVRYQQGSYRGAKAAYAQKLGDCEDLSALLIALCRISEIPARTVWVEGHAYPEFYLEREPNKGDWFPVQLHGSEAFGSISETRPILQKGDRYRDPATKQMLRYLPQQAVAFGGQAKLAVSRTILELEAP